MKRIVIDFPNGYDEVLSMTAIGRDKGTVVNVVSCAFDLEKGNHIYCDGDGTWRIESTGKDGR
jgi:hypothetical protein